MNENSYMSKFHGKNGEAALLSIGYGAAWERLLGSTDPHVTGTVHLG